MRAIKGTEEALESESGLDLDHLDDPRPSDLFGNDWNWASFGHFPASSSSSSSSELPGDTDGTATSSRNSSSNNSDLTLPMCASRNHEHQDTRSFAAGTQDSQSDIATLFVTDLESFDLSSFASFDAVSHVPALHDHVSTYGDQGGFWPISHPPLSKDTSSSPSDTATLSPASGIAPPNSTPSSNVAGTLDAASSIHGGPGNTGYVKPDALSNDGIGEQLFIAGSNTSGTPGHGDAGEEEYTEGEDDGDEAEQDGRERTPATVFDGRADFLPDLNKFADPIANGLDTQTHFSGIDEVRAYLRAEETRPNDGTIPFTQLHKQALVNLMLQFMKTTEFALDNENMLKPFQEARYSDPRMEAACWQLLEATIDRSINGPLLSAYNNFRKQKEKYSSFADRMSYILQAMAVHKTICKRLMDPPYIFSLVDDPLAADKRVRSNKNLNARKGDYIRTGQQVLNVQPNGKKKNSRRQAAPTPPARPVPARRTRARFARTQATNATSASTSAPNANTSGAPVHASASQAPISRASVTPVIKQQNGSPNAITHMNNVSNMDGQIRVNSLANGYVSQQNCVPDNMNPWQTGNNHPGQQSVGDIVHEMTSPAPFNSGSMHHQQNGPFYHQPAMGVNAFNSPHATFSGDSYHPTALGGGGAAFSQETFRRWTDPTPYTNACPPYMTVSNNPFRMHGRSDPAHVAQSPMAGNVIYGHTQLNAASSPMAPLSSILPTAPNGHKRSSPTHGTQYGHSGSPKRRR